MNLLDRLIGLYKSEPAVLKGFVAGAVGLVALWVDVPGDLADNLVDTLGYAILLGDGLWIRRSVSPVDGN